MTELEHVSGWLERITQSLNEGIKSRNIIVSLVIFHAEILSADQAHRLRLRKADGYMATSRTLLVVSIVLKLTNAAWFGTILIALSIGCWLYHRHLCRRSVKMNTEALRRIDVAFAKRAEKS